MLLSKLADIENKIVNSKLFSTVNNNGLKILQYNKPKNKALHYYEEEIAKKKIVLHYTVGNLLGDFGALTSSKISTSYLIARNGQVIELFNPKYWAYHLGKNALGGNELQSKLSIGIEISNYGWLERKGNNLYTAYNMLYCTLDDKDAYTFTEIPYRPDLLPGKFKEGQYWANFTEPQYENTKKLLGILTKQFMIPYSFLPPEKRLAHTSDVIGHKGICTHVNYRKDKWDIGPNFNWSKIQ